MNATTLFSRGLIGLLSIFLLVSFSFGGNLNLQGSATYAGTWNVKGNINNTGAGGVNSFTGVVQLTGTSPQSIGYGGSNAINFATLTASNGSAKEIYVSSSVSTTIDVTTNSGTKFILSGGITMNISGAITNSGSAGTPYDFSNASSEVIYSGSGQTIWGGSTSGTYDRLTVSGSGTKSMGGDVTVASALSVNNGDLSIGAHTLTVNGSYPIGATAVTGSGSSNLILNGSSAITSLAVTGGLNNFTLNRALSTVTLTSGLLVAGVATITTGYILIPTTKTLTLSGTGTVISGNPDALNLVSGDTVNYSSANNTVFAAHYYNLTFEGGQKTLPNASSGTLGIAEFLSSSASTVIHNGGTVDFNGTSAQTIPKDITWNNLTTSNSGTKTAEGTISIASNFTNTSSTTLDMLDKTLSLGSITSNIGTVKFGGASNGLVIGGTGTVEYNGTNEQTIAGHSSNTYRNLIFSNNGLKKITSASGKVHTTGSLTTNTAPVQVGADASDNGAILDIAGDFNVNSAVTNYGTVYVGD